jgi:ribosome-associated protein
LEYALQKVETLKESTLTSEERRDAIVAAAEDKKANYITALDLRGKTLIADFFIICSGTSNIHIRSIADGVMESMEKQGIRQRRIEGYSEATWVLLDYGDAIVHVMSEEQRSFYGLEKLWTGQAPPAREPDRLEGMGIGEFEEDETDDDYDEEELDEDEDSEDEELEDAAVDEPKADEPRASEPEKTHGHAA